MLVEVHMHLNDDLNSVEGFYMVDDAMLAQTVGETRISNAFDLGGGLIVSFGLRLGRAVWLLQNSRGHCHGLWVLPAR
jgi:hypothetical protein